MSKNVRSLVAGLLLAAAFGLAACGGDDSPAEPSVEQASSGKEIVAIAGKLRQAYDDKDGAAACDLLDPRDLKAEFGGRKGCIKRVNAAISQDRGRPELSFDEVTIDGDTASAKASSKSGETSYEFVKVDGKWYIDITPPSDSTDSSG